MKRDFIGIENDAGYLEMARNRIDDAILKDRLISFA
jgi:DNA modification methylase